MPNTGGTHLLAGLVLLTLGMLGTAMTRRS